MLEVSSGKTTGLQAIMQKWRDEELKKQGGKFAGHGWWPWGLTAFDYDGDGDVDLLPSHHGLPGGILIKNLARETGKLEFVNVTREMGLVSRNLPGGVGLRPCAVDLNGDGWLDVVGCRSPHYFYRQGKGFEAVGQKGFHSLAPHLIADVNGDGYPDILDWKSSVWHYDPKARDFVNRTGPHPVEARLPQEVAADLKNLKEQKEYSLWLWFTDHDLNGDGVKDVVWQGWQGYSGKAFGRYLLSDSDGKLTDQTEKMGLAKLGAPVCFADFTGDGAVDVLVARGERAGVYVNDGRGRFTVKEGPVTDLLRKVGPYLQRAYAADLDDDGDLDLVVMMPRSGTNVIYENKGGGEFAAFVVQKGWCDGVNIRDVDGDGRLDVVIGGPGNDVTIYRGRSANKGTFCNLHVRMDKPNWAAAGAVVEIFRAGEMDKKGSCPRLCERAHADGSPVHVGLGKEATFDARVVFPGKQAVLLRNVRARPHLQVTPDGKLTELKR